VNVACGTTGRIVIEVLDGADSIAVSQTVGEDHVRTPVRWNGGFDLKAVNGRPARLKFSLENAGLYAFWVE